MLVAVPYTASATCEMIGPFQVSVMEEKVKLSNLKNVGSTGSLHQKYQELLKAVQGKDERIGQLEAQLEKQVRTPRSRAPVPSVAPAPIGPGFLSRAPLLDPPMVGSSLPLEPVLSCGDFITGRYTGSQAGHSVGKGPWRQTDLGFSPTSSSCCSRAVGRLPKSLLLILHIDGIGAVMRQRSVRRVNE